ncbi:MAG: PIN domain-containing protein [Deltaproteobacteria bacterium]|nr:PIN domain-containing protein [Deltaproteobacteria bacterium]
MSTVYLDTHAAVFLYAGLEEKLPVGILDFINSHETLISPMVELEIQYLFEVGRLKEKSAEIITGLVNLFDIHISQITCAQVIRQALDETWTRDVFDRMIVAEARLNKCPLLSKDRLITKHYDKTIWDL